MEVEYLAILFLKIKLCKFLLIIEHVDMYQVDADPMTKRFKL